MQKQNGSISHNQQNQQSIRQSANMINPSQKGSIHSQHQLIKSTNPNIQSNQQSIQQGNSIRNSQNSHASQQMKSSFPTSSKLSESKLKKSSLKASRNKSPPQIKKSSNGKVTDNSGNDYVVPNKEEKDEEEIKKSVAKEFNNLLKKSMAQEQIKVDKSVGDGFRTFAQLSKGGRNQNGEKKTNQDTPLIHINSGNIGGFNIFGVLDGHGEYGQFVSQYCRNYFIKKFTEFAGLCKKRNLMTPEAIYNELKKTNFSYIYEIFNKVDMELAMQGNFDSNFSGTTCNLVIQLNKYLICASVGDSRGILIEDKGDKQNLGIVQLSTDQKPDLPGEMNRIISNGGMVDQMTGYNGEKVGPPRVWKLGANYPGLAMSRSLGDFEAKRCGVISTPQIVEYTLNSNSKYLTICSDGVWEFISNEKVRDLGNIFYKKNNVGGFCTELVRFAVFSWEQYDIIRDDITVVCVYF